MFLIFGTRTTVIDDDHGHFYCPKCAGDRQYVKKVIRKDLTFFFMRVLEGNIIGQFVECQDCKGVYELSALNRKNPVSEARCDTEKSLKYILYRVLLSNGPPDVSQIDEVRAVFRDITRSSLDDIDVYAEALEVERESIGYEIALASIARHLRDDMKERMIRAGLRVALAGGPVNEKHVAALGEIGKFMGVTPAHLRGVVAEFE